MLEMRPARPEDTAFWRTLDAHIAPQELARKLRDRRAFVLWRDGDPVGVLRYGLLWDTAPFLTLLYLQDGCRRQGLGRMAMEQWERELREQGYDIAFVSTQADEEAQHFYRRLGYRDVGAIVMDVPGYQQPPELFLVKAL